MFPSRAISTTRFLCMAASAPARRARTCPTGRPSRFTAGTSNSRPTSISRTADRSRQLRCSRRSRSRCRRHAAPTSLNTILEFGYALNTDETRGLLAGVQHTGVAVDSAFVRINPNIVGYVGGYYQWDNNWKFTGRVGVQSFGGAQLLQPDTVRAFHPADRQARPRPNGRQRQPPVRDNGGDLMGAEAILPVDGENAALPGEELARSARARKVLTRRANHRHIFSIAGIEPAPGTGCGLFEIGVNRATAAAATPL